VVVLSGVGRKTSYLFTKTRLGILGWLPVVLACDEVTSEPSSLVTAPRVLAIVAEPPEAAPGEVVRLSALIVDGAGTRQDDLVSWDFCEERKALAEPGPVSPRCAEGAVRGTPIGPANASGTADVRSGAGVTGTLPTDGCRLFGPERPAPKPGEAAGRPTDPDGTGGFYQPLFLRTPNAGATRSTLAEVRLSCGLGAAPQEQIVAFGKRYTRNQNPQPTSLVVPATLAAGARGFVRLAWPTCPETDSATERPAPCGGPETFVVYDAERRALLDRRETFRVSWFTTGGAFDEVHTGESDDHGAINGFTVPNEAGTLTIWAVVRDDRGGVGYQTATLTVTR
jgi:hypothetical protein